MVFMDHDGGGEGAVRSVRRSSISFSRNSSALTFPPSVSDLLYLSWSIRSNRMFSILS